MLVGVLGYGLSQRGGKPWTSETREPTLLLDEFGNMVWATCLHVSVGDNYVGQANYRATVVRVEGNKAYLKRDAQQARAAVAGTSLALPLGASSKLICLYSTHTDESYVPTDGSEALPGQGGIIKVASAFAQALSSVGFVVKHDPTAHDPHDAMAYTRSRRTATALAALKPYAMFDVHRDAAPAEAYAAVVRGVEIQQIMIVVGRQNPFSSANMFFALRVKQEADRMYPGLIRGIFMASGDYNQDLDPGSLLLEVGTHMLPREHAERSVSFLARVLASLLGVPGFPS
ncbi:MAG: stage II sporulation protein P [Bacillota bacterium]